MLGSPVPIVLLLVGYLYFVKVIGPKMMADREPFNLQSVINLYNIMQILINLYVGFVVSWSGAKMIGWARESIPQCPTRWIIA